MWRAQLPFVNSAVSLQAALMALKDQQFVQDTLALNQQGLHQIAMGLTSLDLSYLPSACNFITFKCENNGDRLYNYLLQQGIIVRPLKAYGLPDYIRVSVGKSIHNERFIEAIKHYYNHI
jgi:histidinol-phosphate aminotransferase